MIHKPSLFICILLSVFAIACKNTSKYVPLTLKKSTFAGVDEIDTIDAYPQKGLYLLQLTRNGHLGNYAITYGIEKQTGPKLSDKIRYEADNAALRTVPTKLELWYWYDKDYLLLMERKLSDYGHG